MFNLFKKKSKEIEPISEQQQYQEITKVQKTPVYLKALKLKEICSQINSGTEKRYSEVINSIRQDMQDIEAFNRSLESYSGKVHYCLSESGNKFHMQILKKAAG